MKAAFPRTYESQYQRELGHLVRREIQIDPVSDGLTPQAILRVARHAGKGGIVNLVPGAFSGMALDRSIELVSRESGATSFHGTITIRAHSGSVSLKGLRFQPTEAAPALVIHSGSVFCEDCEFFGLVEVRGTGRLHIKNCLLRVDDTAISLHQQAFAEIIGSRISGSPAGVALFDEASCAMFSCRMEHCQESRTGEAGAAIFCDSSAPHALLAEGTEFFENQIGLYVKSARSVQVLGCHFRNHAVSAFITEGAVAEAMLEVECSRIEGGAGAEFPAVSLGGGQARFSHVNISATDGAALSANGTAVEIESSRVSSSNVAAAEVSGGTLLSRNSLFLGQGVPGLRLSRVTGTVTGGTVAGEPPVATGEPHSVLLKDVSDHESHLPTKTSKPPKDHEGTQAMDLLMEPLEDLIGQAEVKEELSRLLRLAFAARERRRQGLSDDTYSYSGILVGPPHSGQLQALQIFAAGLHHLDVLQSSEVRVLTVADMLVTAPESLGSGLLLVTQDDQHESRWLSEGVADALLQLNHALAARGHLFLEGDREELQTLLRSRTDLAREFTTELRFTHFNPIDLSTLFASHCEQAQIPLSHDAKKKIPVMFHSLHDRLQRRLLNVDGVAHLFITARHNFLDRCARSGRFDAEMEAEDIMAPMDRATSAILERSAELVGICPSCQARNPWLAGLAPDFICSHCGADYTTPWGFLRHSSYLRHKDSPQNSFRTGAIALRRTLATMLRR